MRDSKEKRCLCIDIPAMDYGEAWNLQGRLVTARKDRIIDTNVILLLEHPPIFTLGSRGGLNNL
ncbi:MAG: octanoyltransferase, partial [Deltaproteobacteria bacterium]